MVTASVGVAQLLPDENPAAMLRRSDQALYASKEAGRNCTHWHDGRSLHRATSDRGQEPPHPSRNRRPDSQARRSSDQPPTERVTANSPQYAGRGTRIKDDLLAYPSQECDRTVFFAQVRLCVARWLQTGTGFSVMLVQVDTDDQAVCPPAGPEVESESWTPNHVLAGVLREGDIVGRYRRACYALLLPDTKLAQALIVAHRVRQVVNEFAQASGSDETVWTVGLGLAEVSEGDDAVGLLQRAEAALAAAGRNRVFYHDGRQPSPAESEKGAGLFSGSQC